MWCIIFIYAPRRHNFFWVFKRKGDLIYGREALSGISKIFTPGASFQTCQRCGKERGKLLPWQCFGENGPANKYHLKAAWSKKCSETQFYFLLQILPPEFVVTHKADVIFENAELQNTHKKISVLQEYGCTFFSFAGRKHVCPEYQLSFQFSIFLGEQNLHGTAVEQSKMVSQKDSPHLGTSCWHDFVNFSLTLWILNWLGSILVYNYVHMCLCASSFLSSRAGLWSHANLSFSLGCLFVVWYVFGQGLILGSLHYLPTLIGTSSMNI